MRRCGSSLSLLAYLTHPPRRPLLLPLAETTQGLNLFPSQAHRCVPRRTSHSTLGIDDFSRVQTVTEAAPPLPIAAAHHPAHLHALRTTLFPKAKSSARADGDEHSNVTSTSTSAVPLAVVERLAAIDKVNASLRSALANAQSMHAQLQRRLEKAIDKAASHQSPERTKSSASGRQLKLDTTLWSPRHGKGVHFKVRQTLAPARPIFRPPVCLTKLMTYICMARHRRRRTSLRKHDSDWQTLPLTASSKTASHISARPFSLTSPPILSSHQTRTPSPLHLRLSQPHGYDNPLLVRRYPAAAVPRPLRVRHPSGSNVRLLVRSKCALQMHQGSPGCPLPLGLAKEAPLRLPRWLAGSRAAPLPPGPGGQRRLDGVLMRLSSA